MADPKGDAHIVELPVNPGPTPGSTPAIDAQIMPPNLRPQNSWAEAMTQVQPNAGIE